MGFDDGMADYLARPEINYQDNRSKNVWQPICVCGHTGDFHAPEIGGTFLDRKGGFTVDGCRGAIPNRDVPVQRLGVGEYVYTATCPCREMRPVADVDRPGRMFRQKVYTRDFVHPFVRGTRAMRTWLAGQKRVKDPDAEFDLRLRWRDSARRCAVCGSMAGAVIPAYSTKNRDSEMRCKDHYTSPIG